MTECSQSCLPFAPHFSRDVVARFDGGQITTEAGHRHLAPVRRLFPRLPTSRPDRTQRQRVGAAARVQHRLGLRGSERPRSVAARPLVGAPLWQAGRAGRAPAAGTGSGQSRGGQEHLKPAGTDAGGCQAGCSLQKDRHGRGGRRWSAGGSLHPGPAAATEAHRFGSGRH